MILMDKMMVGDGLGVFDSLKDRIKSLRNKLDNPDKKSKKEKKRDKRYDSDSLYDDMWDSWSDYYLDLLEQKDIMDTIQDMTSQIYDSYSRGSGFGFRKHSHRSAWSDDTDFFDPSSFGAWSSRTYATTPSGSAKTTRKPDAEEVVLKLCRHARKDWKHALIDVLFVNEICALFGHSNKGLDESRASVLIEACSLVGAPICEFPLEEAELGDAVTLRNIMMAYDLSEKLLSDSERENMKAYAEKFSSYSSQIDDLVRIWAYASRKFCGSEHLVPVSNLEDLIKSQEEKSFGHIDDLAKAIGADVMLDAYFSGVPADDIVA